MKRMSDVETAWLAGLFEGEGCLTRHNSGWSMKVCMTDADVIQRVQDVTECGTFLALANRRGNRKPTYRWTISNREQIKSLVDQMLPLMGERRSARMREFLGWYEWRVATPKRTGNPDSGKRVPGKCPKHPGADAYKVSKKCVPCSLEYARAHRAAKGARQYRVDRHETPGHLTA